MALSWHQDTKYAQLKDYIQQTLNLSLGQFEKAVLSLSQACPKSVTTHSAALILLISKKPVDSTTLMNILGQTNRTRFKKNSLDPLIEAELLGYTIPDKPQSLNQKYKTTDKGIKLLDQIQEEKAKIEAGLKKFKVKARKRRHTNE